MNPVLRIALALVALYFLIAGYPAIVRLPREAVNLLAFALAVVIILLVAFLAGK